MTPAQQSALEVLAGRSLSADDIAALGPMVDARRDDLIEAHLSAGRVKYVETRKVEIGVIGAYAAGPVAADALLAKLEAYADAGQPLSRLVTRSLRALKVEPGLNLGDPATRAMLAELAAGGVITAAEADAITDVCIGYDSDTTGGTDANIVPLTWHDFAVTPNGGDITVDVPVAGFYRATSAT